MSFIFEIISKKKELKSCQTVVTSLGGNKFIETKNNSGEIQRKELGEVCAGFVVDEKLDLQVVEILEFLYLSSQDVVQDYNLLVSHNITHVLSIGVSLYNCQNSDISFIKCNLLDEPGADLIKALMFCSEIIDSIRKSNKNNKVLVHCNAGYSRAPAIIIGYLMKTFGYTLCEAYSIIKEKRNIKPNDGFMKQLKEFETKLKKLKHNYED